MDVRIGVTYSTREIDVQLTDDADAEELRQKVESALGGDDAVLWLTDKRGRIVGVPAEKVAYVEIGTDSDSRAIGFSS